MATALEKILMAHGATAEPNPANLGAPAPTAAPGRATTAPPPPASPPTSSPIPGPCPVCGCKMFWRNQNSQAIEVFCCECDPAPHMAMVSKFIAWQDGKLEVFLPAGRSTSLGAPPAAVASREGPADVDGLTSFTTPDGALHVRLATVARDTTYQQPDETQGHYERRLRKGWAYESMAAVLDRRSEAKVGAG